MDARKHMPVQRRLRPPCPVAQVPQPPGSPATSARWRRTGSAAARQMLALLAEVPRLPVLSSLLLAVAFLPLPAQRITVFSEFQRPRPDGEVAAVDRVALRREILSPAMVRNGWISLLFTVEAPPGESYTIYLAQNPDATAKADLYQLEYVDRGGEWIPDGLRPVQQPVQAVLGEGQRAQGYLLDLFLPASAPVERFRLEIQLHAAGRWTIYPMEIRPMETTAPAAPPLRGSLPPVEARADETLRMALRGALCAAPRAPEVALNNLRAVVLRNALQDLAIAREKSRGMPGDLIPRFPLVGGWSSQEEFCVSAAPAPLGPEWWLRIRGYLYQGIRLPELEALR